MINEESGLNTVEFSPQKPSQDEIIRMDDEVTENIAGSNSSPIPDDEDMDESQFDNIIPLDKIKHGWSVLSGIVCSAASKIQTKAVETYNSETVVEYRKRTAEVVVPAWEKTCEAATPYWEATKATAAVAAEKTKEGGNHFLCLLLCL